MKTYRTEQVPATTREMLERTVCDLCHKEIEPVRLHSPYRIDNITVERHAGSDYLLDPDTQRIVWAYDSLDKLIEEVRILNAIIDDRLPRKERDEARARYDPRRGVVEKWCEDSKWEGEGI